MADWIHTFRLLFLATLAWTVVLILKERKTTASAPLMAPDTEATDHNAAQQVPLTGFVQDPAAAGAGGIKSPAAPTYTEINHP